MNIKCIISDSVLFALVFLPFLILADMAQRRKRNEKRTDHLSHRFAIEEYDLQNMKSLLFPIYYIRYN